MASEAHNAKKQKVLHIEGRPVDLPRKAISSSTKKIMKEVRYLCLPVTEVNIQTKVYSFALSRTGDIVVLSMFCASQKVFPY